MLIPIKTLGHRAAEFSIPYLAKAEKTNVLNTLRDYYGDIEQSCFVPLPSDQENALRNALADASPTLHRLGEEIREKLERDYSLIMISRAWLDHLDIDIRAALLMSMAISMGSPTPTDKVNRKVVWDIKPLGDAMEYGHVPTFSEHANEASLHTDTQYYENPERFMLLYYNRPAQCGGGVSFCRDISCIENKLAQHDEGRWALDVLRHEKFPFRIPVSFTSDGEQTTEEVTFAPILSELPHVRYRLDTLERGFELHPEAYTPTVKRALAIFQAELAREHNNITAYLQKDSLLALNNHECLHGRTDFTDINRHAFRIRIQDTLSSSPS